MGCVSAEYHPFTCRVPTLANKARDDADVRISTQNYSGKVEELVVAYLRHPI